MSSNYPGALDDTSILRDNFVDDTLTATVHVAAHNNVADAILAIETALGTNPFGSFSTVASAISATVIKAPGANQTIQPSGDFVPLIVKANASQNLASLFEARDSMGNTLAFIDRTGLLNAQSITVQGSPVAPLASPTFTGSPAAPTPTTGDSSTKIATTAFVTTAISAAVPTGTVMPFAVAAAPTGYLLCDGSAVSRSTYASLFALLNAAGLPYGNGNGTTTFNVPDMRGRMATGYAASGGHADVSTLGNNDGVATANRRPKHNQTNSVSASHSLTLPNHVHSVSDPGHVHLMEFTNAQTGSGGHGGINQPPGDDSYNTPQNFNTDGASTGISVGNPTSNPSISGSVSIGGTIGPSGTNPLDAPAWLVLNYIIKT